LGHLAAGDFEGSPVFVKAIPLTEREYAYVHSTRNRFRLPTY
jgi:hypothetical protein